MALVIYTTFAASVWLILWAIGAKPFDAFMVAALILLLGAAHRIVTPHLPGRSRDE